MIVLNTNGKYEYSSFCVKANSETAEGWLEKYKDFIVQHRENIIMEFDLVQRTANIHLATIPSKRKDINGSPCDTTLTAINAKINGDDYTIMSVLIMYVLKEGFDSLGKIIDKYFEEDFFNVKNQDYIQNPDKEENVQNRLKHNVYEELVKCVQSPATVDLPVVEKDICKAKSVKTVDVAEFETAIRNAQIDREACKYVLIITRLNVTEEKIKTFALKEANKYTKAMIFKISAAKELDWMQFEIKKKKTQLPTKVGIMTVIAGIAVASLMIYLEPSQNNLMRSEETSSTDSLVTSQENKSNVFLSPGTYTDGNLTLRVTDSTLHMFDANDSLIQGFIFRCDSVRKVDE